MDNKSISAKAIKPHRIADKPAKFTRFVHALAEVLAPAQVWIPRNQPSGRSIRFVVRHGGNVLRWEDISEKATEAAKECKCTITKDFIIK